MEPVEMLRTAIVELWGRGRAELVEQSTPRSRI
jgi:hypothetical protein